MLSLDNGLNNSVVETPSSLRCLQLQVKWNEQRQGSFWLTGTNPAAVYCPCLSLRDVSVDAEAEWNNAQGLRRV